MRNPILPLVAALAMILPFASCAQSRESVRQTVPELADQWDRLEQRESQLEQVEIPALESRAREAVATPTLSDDAAAAEALAAANRELLQVRQELVKIEDAAARKQASPLAGLLPGGLGFAAVEALLLVGSKRKRRLYATAFSSVGKGKLLTAAGEILKALGAADSRPEPETAYTASSGYSESTASSPGTFTIPPQPPAPGS